MACRGQRARPAFRGDPAHPRGVDEPARGRRYRGGVPGACLARRRPRPAPAQGWDRLLLEALDKLGGEGIAYGNDLHQGEALPTAPVISSGIVGALGWMMGPGLKHMHVDDVWRDLGQAAGCLAYVPEVVIEHQHPDAGKPVSKQGRYTESAAGLSTDRDALPGVAEREEDSVETRRGPGAAGSSPPPAPPRRGGGGRLLTETRGPERPRAGPHPATESPPPRGPAGPPSGIVRPEQADRADGGAWPVSRPRSGLRLGDHPRLVHEGAQLAPGLPMAPPCRSVSSRFA